MRYLFVVALLFIATPAGAQPVPSLDEDGCLALSKTMDAKESGRRSRRQRSNRIMRIASGGSAANRQKRAGMPPRARTRCCSAT
jgi:hypothetical protein